jgi:nicotinamide-nucleotide amidase
MVNETATSALCAQLATVLQERGWMLATAESCTGGMIAAACTDLSGSSNWFERGFVTYSNQAKTDLLGVDPDLVTQHGSVSEVVARAMAFGAIRHSLAQAAVAVTGVAGPTGGSPDKPVGLVWFGHFPGDRAAVRAATVEYALRRLLELLV